MSRLKLLIVLLFVVNCSFSQNVDYARKVVDTLTSSAFWGRGYTKNGMQKTADYLSGQFRSFNLSPLNNENYYQPFTMSVNTFPGKMELIIDGKQLEPGVDFIVSPESKGIRGKGTLIQQDSITYVDHDNRVIITLKDKLTWSVAAQPVDFTSILINKNSLSTVPNKIQVNIESKVDANFIANNIASYVKGSEHPDSFIVFTAHYDHLGGMGSETYFPGANDNASGISLLLGLAKYYATHPQPYSIAFICFAAEEAGLVGSKFFVENPLFPLSKIRFLTNVDLVGTGVDGITVVNATEFKKEFDLLNEINSSNNYLAKINARGKAANSDHYWFTENGVPAFFIYTTGGIAAYHDVFDKAATLPLTEYSDLFKLIVDFNSRLMK